MNANVKRAFYYHAHANSLGGSVVQPVQRQIATNASASLATAGGFHTARVEKFRMDGLISIEAGHVRVSGSEHVSYMPGKDKDGADIKIEKRSYRTLTAATVEGLNVLEVLTADRVVAQISIDHPHDGGDATISLLGSRFENLKVHGALVQPKIDGRIFGANRVKAHKEDLTDNSPMKFKELIQVAKDQHEERKKHKIPHKALARFTHGTPDEDLESKGTAVCSLVQTVGAEEPVEIYSHMLHIPDFGNVFLGELLVSHFSAQLTMVRVEMGCMAQGDLSGPSVSSNGRFMP